MYRFFAVILVAVLAVVVPNMAIAQLAVQPKVGQTNPFPNSMNSVQILSVVIGTCQGSADLLVLQRYVDSYKVFKENDAGDTDRAVYFRYVESHIAAAEIVAAHLLKMVRVYQKTIPEEMVDKLVEVAQKLKEIERILANAEEHFLTGRDYWEVDQQVTKAIYENLRVLRVIEETLRKQVGKDFYGLYALKGYLNVCADYLENLRLIEYKESSHYVAAAKMVYGQAAYALYKQLDKVHKTFEPWFTNDLNEHFRKALSPLYVAASHGHALGPNAWMSQGDEAAVRAELAGAAKALRSLMLLL